MCSCGARFLLNIQAQGIVVVPQIEQTVREAFTHSCITRCETGDIEEVTGYANGLEVWGRSRVQSSLKPQAAVVKIRIVPCTACQGFISQFRWNMVCSNALSEAIVDLIEPPARAATT